MGFMAETAATTAPDTASTTFLVELEHTWALFRLYGGEHPAFKKRSEAAAACVAGPIRVGVSPTGFIADTATLVHDDLQPLARRLVGMGIVGLTIEPGLSSQDVGALVRALHESERARSNTQAVGARISNATGG